ncbi:TPA: acetate--CoA ligase family protein [archaeon]|uniref:Acetate--CoA ligase family protein n=1 Tax=Candidatus Naiadarchaeum limnaeum TaxID=2756139 RepID=A0A832V3P6_9ARCH|nr:acetate--CoA ligase family protein [Candidatus Naiadarchaeum limnaeum]
MAKSAVLTLFKRVKAQKRAVLTEVEAKQVLDSYGIPTTKGILVNKKEDAIKAAQKIGFPVVMKVVSPEIVHKTEAKAVAVGLKTVEEVAQAFETLQKNARAYKKGAKIHGVLIQEMASGKEVIIGAIKDVQFGPTVMFGIGGVLVEIMKDVTFRVAPISKLDAQEMLHELKGYKILQGVRGQKPINESAILNILLKVSQLVSENPQIKELDINPLFVNEKEAKAADARIILE